MHVYIIFLAETVPGASVCTRECMYVCMQMYRSYADSAFTVDVSLFVHVCVCVGVCEYVYVCR